MIELISAQFNKEVDKDSSAANKKKEKDALAPKQGVKPRLLLLFFVYESPDRQKRRQHWEGFNMVIPPRGVPWAAIGDFNALLSSRDKRGVKRDGIGCSPFGDFLEVNNLQDLGFKGSHFTWYRGRIFERLDRAIGKETWIRVFLSCSISHLPRLKSDHISLLSLNSKVNLLGGRPFSFLAG
ncbi:hypothetical protein Gotri_003539 [Gossypium trilobum]|uniref:Endonuclease/exonuclease/phosphatase domain-containing protein n=1 Tax=Gossypium trilobum TaxID=34281 RepID=A0A7J9F271_9ROSI|nr:hypothetical protein [Gossypium trilobum]